MKAMVIRRYGGPDVFEPGEIERPTPGPGEVLVRVRGSSVNPVDCAIRSGRLRWIVRVRLPAVLGVDVAGEVIGAGAGVTRFTIGDRVFARPALSRSAPHTFRLPVRGAPIGRARRTLRRGGVLVTLTGIPPQAVLAQIRNLVSSRRTVFMFVQTSGALLEGLARLIENGAVRPIVERTYSWNELAEAHRRIETGRVTGKIAILPQ